MDFSLSAEQQLLKKEVQQFLDNECPKKIVRQLEKSELGYSPEIWKKMADLGWLGLIVPEEHGGVGGNLIDLAVMFEEIGRATFPSPMFSTILYGVIPLLEAGNAAHKGELLPKVVKGELILTMALIEPEADRPQFITAKAHSQKDGFTIEGTKLFVPNAHAAGCILVIAKTGEGLNVFLVRKGAKGIGLTPLKTVGGDRQFEVALNKVHVASGDAVGKIGQAGPLVDSTLRKATAIHCVQTVGVMQQALAMTAEYTSKRVQFGRPIGSFQAVQHRLADMLTDVEGSRWLSYQAVSLLDKGRQAAREVSVAKAWTSEACQRVAYAAQHLHGGIGMDLDYDLHFYFQWAKAMDLNLGTAAFHLATIEPILRE
ncbi:MAG: acyl-CoA dehydrogenase [Chloroflexi bacterium]|nr:acyl-CoA dehydrogenase [Chloroflexota bacterium]